MKPLVVMLVAALSLAVGADGHARHRHHRVRAAVHKSEAKAHRARHRAHERVRRTTGSEPSLRTSYDDELALSPRLLEQLQRNLTDGGYYSGAIDGRLTARTRSALAGFQREYHLEPANGHLDRRTANALLGRDVVLAAAPPARG